MFDRFSCTLYDSMKTPGKDALTIMKNEKVALTALYISEDAILFFALFVVIPQEM